MDKTSASGKVGSYDTTTAGAKAVFAFLTAQSKDVSSYGSNPLWKVVDGPWKLVSYQTTGYAKFAAADAGRVAVLGAGLGWLQHRAVAGLGHELLPDELP
jgi:hypothetical protein